MFSCDKISGFNKWHRSADIKPNTSYMNSGLLLVPLGIIYRSVTLGYPLLLLMDTGCSHHLPVHLYRSVLHLHKCHEANPKIFENRTSNRSFWHSFPILNYIKTSLHFYISPYFLYLDSDSNKNISCWHIYVSDWNIVDVLTTFDYSKFRRRCCVLKAVACRLLRSQWFNDLNADCSFLIIFTDAAK